jgi:hypothetical protein
VTVFSPSIAACGLGVTLIPGTYGTIVVNSTVKTEGTVKWTIENSTPTSSGTTLGPVPQNDNSQGQNNDQGQNDNNQGQNDNNQGRKIPSATPALTLTNTPRCCCSPAGLLDRVHDGRVEFVGDGDSHCQIGCVE